MNRRVINIHCAILWCDIFAHFGVNSVVYTWNALVEHHCIGRYLQIYAERREKKSSLYCYSYLANFNFIIEG